MVRARARDDIADSIRAGDAPPGLVLDRPLVIENAPGLTHLPAGLTVRKLTLKNCPDLAALPADLRVRQLDILDCPALATLPAGLACYELHAPGSAFVELPAGLRVEYRLDLRDSTRLTTLPRNLTVGSLVLRGCTALEELPDGLDVTFLDLEGCTRFARWPRRLTLRCGHLNLARCPAVTELPAAAADLAQLNVRDCARLTKLPAGLVVRSWVEVAGSGLGGLPRSMAAARLRWRGVSVSERVAFRPDTITADEIITEPNAEVRRVMLERVGFEWCFEQTAAEVLDADRDPGGERKLLRLDLPGDEPLVCVSLACPSTGRRYVLRVPPATDTCHKAAAWMAGFDDPAAYAPLIET